jgi:hypothetical protein
LAGEYAVWGVASSEVACPSTAYETAYKTDNGEKTTNHIGVAYNTGKGTYFSYCTGNGHTGDNQSSCFWCAFSSYERNGKDHTAATLTYSRTTDSRSYHATTGKSGRV